ncbi:hypothetical protein E3Q22_03096 [Wallemia mellicola]|uniref:Phytanoyl-CoA dioxygenase family protein n=1 Tax=Wallemia mellicola TaxID=1708541 RepID=A0A4T0MT01_9BASI|nr:hypothetical protein E3Q23_02826 [Wallemia mellicola]TIB77385.1 hypothetical protein E3Q22_03096 [Wallemia mellicola]TIB83160.1 hypothetical protein E3Q21_03045 [Wallemia mellicola]TIB85966.1 hypothetical protein E3Q20_03036 [Wallemia mellicola]TIC10310.1 hypothetical protein E3Q14_02913 [Wallemia mellicola]
MEYKNYLENDGYVIIDGFIDNQEIDKLRQAANDAINLTRTHNWPYRRVVGKQFPPWTDEDSPDSWGVQHLMHPDLKMPIFRQFYASDKLVELAANLVGCSPEYLQMELFNMLILPTRSSFNLSWHRDHVLHSADEQEERDALTTPHYGVQFNAALYDDSCLWIVPKSHKMVRSPAQRALSCETKPADNPAEMPGAIQVHLKAGQILFYDANILHCAQYPCTPPSPPRATLHGSYGDLRGGSHRAIGVLQHGLEWMKDPSFGDGPGHEMWEKLMAMYNQAKADDKLGKYSLNG